MTNEELLREISTLSMEARLQIEKYVALLKKQKKAALKKNLKKPLRDEAFFGIWKDREEMHDSTTWVRNIRKTHWKS